MAPTNNNKRSRSVLPEAEDDVVNNIKDAVLAIDSKSVYAHAINKWTSNDLEVVQSKVKELQASLDKAKKDIEYRRQKRYKSTLRSLVPAAAAAAAAAVNPTTAANPTTDVNVKNAVTIVSMEIVVQHVSMSGFLSAEDVGRFLLCTCKALTAPLTEDFIARAIANSASSSSDRYDHVPRSMLEKHGHKWIYGNLVRKHDSNEEEAAAQARLMQEPTTLSVDNLTLYVQIFSPDNAKVFSLALAEEKLTQLSDESEIAIELSQEEEPALFEHLGIGGDHHRYEDSDVYAIVHGFREDTNQLVRLLDQDGLWGENRDLEFMGHEFDSVCIQISICPPDEDGDGAYIALGNVYAPDFVVNGEPDPHYNFFRALHHFAPWEG